MSHLFIWTELASFFNPTLLRSKINTISEASIDEQIYCLFVVLSKGSTVICFIYFHQHYLYHCQILSPNRVKNFLFSTSSGLALGSTQPPIQGVTRALSLGVKLPEREADHSPPTSAEVKKNVDLYIHSPIRLHGVVLNWLSTGITVLFTAYNIKFSIYLCSKFLCLIGLPFASLIRMTSPYLQITPD
jgi:hypothetical protein